MTTEQLAQWAGEQAPFGVEDHPLYQIAAKLRELEEKLDYPHKEIDTLRAENERLANHAANMMSGRAAADAENERLRKTMADTESDTVDQLRAENERLRDALSLSETQFAQCQHQYSELRAALEKHGRHSPDCPRFSATFYGQESDEFPVPGVKCTCGLADALGGES